MLAESFLHTVTIQAQIVTYDGVRPNVPTWSNTETGIDATIVPISVRSRGMLFGHVTEATHLIFLPAGTSISQGDIVVDEDTGDEYTVSTSPLTYKNPTTGEDNHIQCEAKLKDAA